MIDDLIHDLVVAFRSLSRRPGGVVVAAVTLGVGMGCTAVALSLIRAVLGADLGFVEPERIVTVQESARRQSLTMGFTLLPSDRFEHYRAADVFSAFGGYAPRAFAWRRPEGTRSLRGALATSEFFDVVGRDLHLGRPPSFDGEPAVVLSYSLWQSAFAGATDILGQTVHLNGDLYQVSGVAPEGFSGPFLGLSAEVWVPPAAHRTHEERAPAMVAVARLRRGVSRERAEERIDALAAVAPDADVRGAILPRLDGLPPEGRRPFYQFMALIQVTALLVLLTASANLAGVLGARHEQRRRDVALRVAVGASRSRVLRQLLTETVALYLAGGVLGLALAHLVTSVMHRIPLPGPLQIDFSLTPDATVIVVGLALAGLVGVVFGTAPALRLTVGDGRELFRSTKGPGASAGVLRDLFLAGQVACCTVLLILTGLLVRSIQQSVRADLGFTVEDVWAGTVNVRPLGYDEERGRAVFSDIVARVSAMEGVTAVGMSSVAVLSGDRSGGRVAPAETASSGESDISVATAAVDAGFFSALRVPVLTGRTFERSDGAGSAKVVVVSQSLAQRLWPEERAVGRLLRFADEIHRVIGVVEDGRFTRIQESAPFLFRPWTQAYSGGMTFYVKGSRGAGTLTQLQEAVRGIDPDIALDEPGPLRALVEASATPQRLGATIVGVFGVIGGFLAIVGIFSATAAYAMRRSHEIGVRLAMGAPRGAVIRTLLVRGGSVLMIGVGAGVIGALMLSQLARSVLFGVRHHDLVMFTAVPLAISLIGLLTAALPAWRASRMDPMRVLVQE